MRYLQGIYHLEEENIPFTFYENWQASNNYDWTVDNENNHGRQCNFRRILNCEICLLQHKPAKNNPSWPPEKTP